MRPWAYYFINGITAYRLVMAPVLILFLFRGDVNTFKWLLGVSFLTDAIDGWLARRFGVTSVFGARLDSIGDDLTVLAGIIGVMVFDTQFVLNRGVALLALLLLLLIQAAMAYRRYGKFTSFHTYLAKIAAVCQGCFFLAFFFIPEIAAHVFIVAYTITALDLLEEIVLVMKLRVWRANVKGLYWIRQERQKQP